MLLPKVINISDLQTQINKKVVFQELINQINKDFLLIGIDYKFKESLIFDIFLVEFNSIITELVDNNFELFLNLLYRIDLSETKIKAIIKSEPNAIYTKITFEILKREWQKVWFRINYRD